MNRKTGRKIVSMGLAVVLISLLMPYNQSSDIKEKKTGFPVGWTDDIRLTFNTTGADDGQNIAVYQNYVHIVHRNIWSGQNEIYYLNSTDGGTTWNQRIRLSPGDPVDCTNPDIGINKSQINAVWNENDGTGREIVYRNSTNGGISWNSPKIISKDDNFNSEGPKIALSEDGLKIHVIWVDSRHGAESVPANTEIYHNRSLDGGITWQGEQRLTNAWYASAPSGIAVNDSNIHITWVDERSGNWEIYYKMSKDNGLNWEDGQGGAGLDRLLTTNATDHILSSLAVNGSTIHVVWVDQEPGPIFSIYYRNSTDNGATWGTIQQLVSPFAGTAYAPNLAVQNDTVHMTYHDNRDGGTPEIYYKNSTDNGATWSPDLRLTELDGFSSGGPKIAVSGSQRHIIWGDQRDGNPEVYYKRYPEVLPDTEPPDINHTPVASANIGQTINITANITDDVSVDAVKLDYTGVNGTNYNVSMTQWNGNWSYEIPGQANIGFVDYFIWASDTSGNVNMTGINQTQINDITKPEINHIPITSKNIGELINITANITDDVGVNKVFLNYTEDVHGVNQNITMNKWGGNWSYEIAGQSNSGFVNYFIWANDTSDNNNMTTISQIQIYDVTDPEINHVPVTSANISEIINITANVTDDVSVNSVYLNYTDVAGDNYNLSMNKNGNNWSYEIPGQINAGNLSYFIWANDTSGNDNQTQVYQIQIIDITKPEIEHTPVTSTNVSDIINITAQITDDVEVDSVYLNYTGVDGINHNISMTKWNGNWSYDISGQLSKGNLTYLVWANDTSGNDNRTIEYSIQINEIIIQDTTPPTIISKTPTGVNVSITTTITITFNESMNISSVENTISISPTITILSYSWNADNTTLTVTPSGNLSYNTTYTITVGIGAKDIAGNNLASAYSWDFTIQPEPTINNPDDGGIGEYWWIILIIVVVAIIVVFLYWSVQKEEEPEDEIEEIERQE